MKEKVACGYCQEYEMVKVNSDAHRAGLCHGCFEELTDEAKQEALKGK
jgi:hypothetical protein